MSEFTKLKDRLAGCPEDLAEGDDGQIYIYRDTAEITGVTPSNALCIGDSFSNERYPACEHSVKRTKDAPCNMCNCMVGGTKNFHTAGLS